MNATNSIYSNGRYAERNPGWHVQDSPWKAAQILKAMKRSGIEPRSVAEIGCGAGAILSELSRHIDAEYFGVDPSSYAISQAHGSNRITLKAGSVEDMGLYDLVLCIDVLEHVEDVFGFLRSLLAKGRSFIFHIPLDMNCYGVLRNVVMVNRNSMGHLHYFNRNTALAALTECGFRVSDWFYTPTIDLYNAPFSNLIKRTMFKLNSDFAALAVCGFSLMVTASLPKQ